MSKVLVTCDECARYHIVDSLTKEVTLRKRKPASDRGFNYVEGDNDCLPEEVVHALDGVTWTCTKCGEVMTIEMYTTTHYHI